MCKCSLCGEILTSPIFYKGLAYGYSCIKKVNPLHKNKKTNFVIAESFEIENFENSTYISAKYEGKKYGDHILKHIGFSINIIIFDNKAYINLLKYK